MKTKFLTLLFYYFLSVATSLAQQEEWRFNPKEGKEKTSVHNRKATFTADEVYLDKRPGDGFLRIRDLAFGNGTIEADIKGKDIPQQSFLGIAFHGVNDSTYDAIYFRPFNFLNPQRMDHSVQYISHPHYTWDRLRNDYPGKYESALQAPPDPNAWFHVRIEVYYPDVKVYVNGSDQPVLAVKQLSQAKAGWLGFWVGYASDGFFKNLRVVPAQ